MNVLRRMNEKQISSQAKQSFAFTPVYKRSVYTLEKAFGGYKLFGVSHGWCYISSMWNNGRAFLWATRFAYRGILWTLCLGIKDKKKKHEKVRRCVEKRMRAGRSNSWERNLLFYPNQWTGNLWVIDSHVRAFAYLFQYFSSFFFNWPNSSTNFSYERKNINNKAFIGELITPPLFSWQLKLLSRSCPLQGQIYLSRISWTYLKRKSLRWVAECFFFFISFFGWTIPREYNGLYYFSPTNMFSFG